MRQAPWWQWMVVVATLFTVSGMAVADEDDVPPYYPMGMAGGCPMGGMGPGYGMMGMGPGMGPGMGMGMGMGRGMGMGMMGGMGPYAMLDLNADQQAKINKIHDEARRKNWTTYGKIQDEQTKLRDLYLADKRDTKAISAVVASIQALERQVLETRLDAHNRMDALLTDAQREQLRQWRSGRGWGRGGMMGGPGGMGRGMMMGP